MVFADEPTGNLDTKTTREIMELFLNFSRQQKITIVLVTHDRNLANYADRIVTIMDGRVVKDAANQSLFDVEKEEAARKAAWENDQLPPQEPSPGEPPAEEQKAANEGTEPSAVPEVDTTFGEGQENEKQTPAALEEK